MKRRRLLFIIIISFFIVFKPSLSDSQSTIEWDTSAFTLTTSASYYDPVTNTFDSVRPRIEYAVESMLPVNKSSLVNSNIGFEGYGHIRIRQDNYIVMSVTGTANSPVSDPESYAKGMARSGLTGRFMASQPYIELSYNYNYDINAKGFDGTSKAFHKIIATIKLTDYDVSNTDPYFAKTLIDDYAMAINMEIGSRSDSGQGFLTIPVPMYHNMGMLLSVIQDSDVRGNATTGDTPLTFAYNLTAVPAPTRPCPLCKDTDDDGYQAVVDCDDSDSMVHPGAFETKHDGIDQNCNGYDLTIDIIKAKYYEKKDKLVVMATSSFGIDADLNLHVHGYGNMEPKNRKSHNIKWVKEIYGIEECPGMIIVCGPEGCESVEIKVVSK